VGVPGLGPLSPCPSEGKSNIRKGGESLVWGPTWLEIKTVKFFEPGHSAGGHDHHRSDGSDEYAVDPVCGMRVSKRNAITRQINGKTYYFCSEECANSFRG
jgi:YHS domain-containing protein